MAANLRAVSALYAMTNALVVDDDPAVRHLLVTLLTDEGYAVAEAANGLEALDLVSRALPDIVLLDLTMPVMDGWVFLERCGLMADCPEFPVVVLSASHRRPADRRVRAFISKPFDLDTIAQTAREISPPTA